MTILDLLHKTDYKKVFNNIYKFYYKDKTYNRERLMDIDAAYYRVFEKLQSTKPELFEDFKNCKIYITNIPDGDLQTVDVCLYDEDEDQLFSIDFIEWSKLLNLPIYKTIKMSDDEILAHFLWEITFWGFNAEDIKKQAEITKNAKTTHESLSFIDT